MIFFFVTSRKWYNLGNLPNERQVQKQPFIYQLFGIIFLVIFFFIHFDNYKPTKVRIWNPFHQKIEIFSMNKYKYAIVHLMPGLFYLALVVNTYFFLRSKGRIQKLIERARIASYVSHTIRSRIFSLLSTLLPFAVISPIMVTLFYFGRGFGLLLVGFGFICFSILCQYFNNFDDYKSYYSALFRVSSPKENITKTKELNNLTQTLGELSRCSRGIIYLNLVMLCFMIQVKLTYYLRMDFMEVYEIKFLFGLMGG